MGRKTTKLDLRELGCQQRHGLVFQCLAVLEPGYSLTIVNDHDPEPLRLQLSAQYADRLSWSLDVVGTNEFHATIQLLDRA